MRTNRTSCIKCAGTGTVSRFLDYKGGVCFDCGGEGTVSTAKRTLKSVGDARIYGDAVLEDPTSVSEEAVVMAFEFFENLPRVQWGRKDYDRRNALGRLIGRVI